MSADTSIDLGLPATPQIPNTPEDVYEELMRLYNAIRSLAVAVDDYTGSGANLFETQIDIVTVQAQLTKFKLELNAVHEQLIGMLTVIPWEQPGAIGSTVPNTVDATNITASGSLKVASGFGVNGAGVSGSIALPAAATDAASTQALSNALRGAFITFGLGS